MDSIYLAVFFVLFALGVVAMTWLVVAGVISRRRDHRTAEERWADEHGDEDPTKVKLYGGPIWNGPGPGF